MIRFTTLNSSVTDADSVATVLIRRHNVFGSKRFAADHREPFLAKYIVE